VALALVVSEVRAEDKPKCFEIRTYYSAPDKFEALKTRFRDHTLKLFEKHGIKVVGFWEASEGPNKGKMLVYVCEYKSREAREEAFKAFRADPDWKKAKADSEVNGSLTEKVEETFLTALEFSKIK
jgi:NIPSNAP